MRIALAQIDTVVGDLDGNRELIRDSLARARDAGADLVVYPELATTGYPPEDLLLRPAFVRAARASVERIAAEADGIVALVGTPWFDGDLANACAVCAAGEVRAVYRKHYLPNYGVFDEHRYFGEGRDLVVLRIGGVPVGITICEDVWQPGPPATDLALAGAELVVNLSASPYHVGKAEDREEMLVTRARDTSAYFAFCNLVGGQDELVFDGHSVVLDEAGEVVARAPGFEQHLLVVDVEPSDAIARRLSDARRRGPRALARAGAVTSSRSSSAQRGSTRRNRRHGTPFASELEQMRLALACGLRDYVEKNRFGEVVIAVSGGIDSAVTAALCADALGPKRVHCVSMPSRFSSDGDAQGCADDRGEPRLRVPRDPDRGRRRDVADTLADDVGRRSRRPRRGEPAGTRPRRHPHGALEHVRLAGRLDREQVGARRRLLDALRDMVGGFALLKDVFKTDVYRLAEHLDARAGRDVDPTQHDRASAERRAARRPARLRLDSALRRARPRARGVRRGGSLARGARQEFDPEVVERALGLVDRAEYKRRQAPPGVKLRPKAFGRDRRTPITNHLPRDAQRSRHASAARHRASLATRGTSAGAPPTGPPRSPGRSREARRAPYPPSSRSCSPCSERSRKTPRYAALPTNRGRPDEARGDLLEPLSCAAKSAARRSPEPLVVRWRRVRQADAVAEQLVLLPRLELTRREACGISSRQKSFRGFAKRHRLRRCGSPGLIRRRRHARRARARRGRRSRSGGLGLARVEPKLEQTRRRSPMSPAADGPSPRSGAPSRRPRRSATRSSVRSTPPR